MRTFPASLFGSDAYTHYTALYTWKSNQMAHAMMGVAGTTLLIYGALKLGGEVWYGAAFVLIPFFKDITDYVSDIADAGGVFELTSDHRCELKRDGVTDFLFWTTGTTLALFMALSTVGNSLHLYAAALLTLLLAVLGIFGFGRSFTKQKKLYDGSGLPYYFRLPSYAGRLCRACKVRLNNKLTSKNPLCEVERFVYGEDDHDQHLILFGFPASHKTTLAAAIGSGLIARDRTIRYITMVQLMEELAATPAACKGNSLGVMHPCEADIVIVDDLIQSSNLNNIPGCLAKKKTVWVVTRREPGDVRRWIKLLRKVLNGRVVAIRLSGPKTPTGTRPRILATICGYTTLFLALTAVVGPLALILCPIEF